MSREPQAASVRSKCRLSAPECLPSEAEVRVGIRPSRRPRQSRSSRSSRRSCSCAGPGYGLLVEWRRVRLFQWLVDIHDGDDKRAGKCLRTADRQGSSVSPSVSPSVSSSASSSASSRGLAVVFGLLLVSSSSSSSSSPSSPLRRRRR